MLACELFWCLVSRLHEPIAKADQCGNVKVEVGGVWRFGREAEAFEVHTEVETCKTKCTAHHGKQNLQGASMCQQILLGVTTLESWYSLLRQCSTTGRALSQRMCYLRHSLATAGSAERLYTHVELGVPLRALVQHALLDFLPFCSGPSGHSPCCRRRSAQGTSRAKGSASKIRHILPFDVGTVEVDK